MLPGPLLRTELRRFANWAREHPGSRGEWATEYPEWGDLWSAAEGVLAQQHLTAVEADDLLEALRLDEECERVKELVEARPAHLLLLAELGHPHPATDVCWQLADALRGQPSDAARGLTQRYLLNADEYVRRRARRHCEG